MLRVFFLIICLMAWTAQGAGQPMEIIYPSPHSSTDARVQYPLQLIRLAFEKLGEEVVLRPSNMFMSQSRSLTEIAADRNIDITWAMTTPEREKENSPIRIPIYKGLIGWRIFLYAPENGVQLGPDTTLAELKKYILIQGHDWPDTDILRANGFNVSLAPNYKGIFSVLASGRVDLFPRSLSEIQEEYESHKHIGIQVEPSILLQYPTAFYFFVNKNNHELKTKLEKGLNMAIDDGSFDVLFYEHHQQVLSQADLGKRHVIYLDNPLLPSNTPLNDHRLWYRWPE